MHVLFYCKGCKRRGVKGKLNCFNCKSHFQGVTWSWIWQREFKFRCVHRDGQSETMTCKCVQEAVHTQELRHHRHSSSSEHRSTQTVFSKCHSPGKVKIMASQKKKKKKKRLGKKNTSWPGVNKCSKQKVTCLKDSSDGLKHFFFPQWPRLDLVEPPYWIITLWFKVIFRNPCWYT